jgi:prevent-host-death family protein
MAAMTSVSVHEAKTHLSRLIEKVLMGEEVVITRNREPVARLSAIKPMPTRRPGRLAGLVHLDDSFFDPLPEEELRAWEES